MKEMLIITQFHSSSPVLRMALILKLTGVWCSCENCDSPPYLSVVYPSVYVRMRKTIAERGEGLDRGLHPGFAKSVTSSCQFGCDCFDRLLRSLTYCVSLASPKAGMAAQSTAFEPLPRLYHIAGRVSSKGVIYGGVTSDLSYHDVIDVFDPFSEQWEQMKIGGDAPTPGAYLAASASLRGDLFVFGGFDNQMGFLNTLHKLDTKRWCWSQLSPQNANGAPMPKRACGMTVFGNNLLLFGGYGIPRGTPEPYSFLKDFRVPPGSGWTNQLHIYSLIEGM